MNVVLWVLQGVLAAAFLMSGAIKVIRPKEQLRARMPFVDDYSPAAVKAIGAVEILGAVGLVLPAITGVATVLTPLAALGLVVVMVLAAITHLRRDEAASVPVNVVLLVLAGVVAWGRFGPYPL